MDIMYLTKQKGKAAHTNNRMNTPGTANITQAISEIIDKVQDSERKGKGRKRKGRKN